MKSLKRFLAALIAAAGLQAHAQVQPGTYTDLWWNPQESGWGMNVVQQLETTFVTLFVYGPDGKPTWDSASDAPLVAIGRATLPIVGGELYKTTGPFHGGPFDPGQVTRTFVGMLSIQALSNERLRVQYEAEGGTVVKEVVRATFTSPLDGGAFPGRGRLRPALTPP